MKEGHAPAAAHSTKAPALTSSNLTGRSSTSQPKVFLAMSLMAMVVTDLKMEGDCGTTRVTVSPSRLMNRAFEVENSSLRRESDECF